MPSNHPHEPLMEPRISVAREMAMRREFPCLLFDGMDRSVVQELVNSARVVSLRARQVVVHVGDVPDRMYVLTSGQGQMYWDSENGQRTILHVFGPGGIAGGETIFRT